MTGVLVFFLGGVLHFLVATATFLLAGTVLVCSTVFFATDQDSLSFAVVLVFLGSGSTKGTGDR